MSTLGAAAALLVLSASARAAPSVDALLLDCSGVVLVGPREIDCSVGPPVYLRRGQVVTVTVGTASLQTPSGEVARVVVGTPYVVPPGPPPVNVAPIWRQLLALVLGGEEVPLTKGAHARRAAPVAALDRGVLSRTETTVTLQQAEGPDGTVFARITRAHRVVDGPYALSPSEPIELPLAACADGACRIEILQTDVPMVVEEPQLRLPVTSLMSFDPSPLVGAWGAVLLRVDQPPACGSSVEATLDRMLQLAADGCLAEARASLPKVPSQLVEPLSGWTQLGVER